MLADSNALERVLANLLSNAAKYSGPHDPIHLRAEVRGRALVITVRDHGDGVAAEHQPHLFDRFFRGDSARACPDMQHHGLGLAIVAAIARMHAGRTLAESEGGQTRVGFTLAGG